MRAEEVADLGIFWALDADLARTAARKIDQRIAAGEEVGPLAGLPIAVKDSVDVAGLPTSFGNPGTLEPAVADADPVSRARAAGAVPLGKVAMDQLGWTTGGWTVDRPKCLNPLDHSRSPGGSSTGSAAAVAAEVTPIAIGADAAGSVRIPAAYCGLVGIRPPIDAIATGGMRITIEGVDCVGPIAASVDDALLALQGLANPGAAHLAAAVRGADPGAAASGLRVAALEDLFSQADAAVAAACRDALALVEGLVALEGAELAWEPKGFGRFLAGGLWRSWGAEIQAEPDRFSPLIVDSAEFGRGVTDEQIDETRQRLTDDRIRIEKALAGIDVVACPTVPEPVPLAEVEKVEISTRFTRLFSALDWPSISLPVGADDAGMPISLQLASADEGFARLLAVARAIEAAPRPSGA